MRDVTKMHGKNQESVSSPCWQQIADTHTHYQLMIDGPRMACGCITSAPIVT